MAVIVPIRGLRYHRRFAGELARLITPPYDVILAADQDRYYAAHPYNIIRLELGRTLPGDGPDDNRYTRSAATLREWLDRGVLVQEEKPALYLYRQDFTVDGEKKTRTGIIGGVKIEPYEKKVVLPHEETLPGHKADRLELMRRARAAFSPVLGLYADPERSLDGLFARLTGRGPDASCLDEAGQGHALWVITEEDDIARVQDLLAGKQVFIADGHHRYETAQAFLRENPDSGAARYVMMTLVNLFDPGLVVLPTHRLVKNLAGIDFPALLSALAQDFLLAEYRLADGTPAHFMTILRSLGAEGRHAFGLSRDGSAIHLLVLKDGVDPARVMPADKSAAWRELDPAILQVLILEKLLGLDAARQKSGEYLAYTRDEHQALASLREGGCQLAFLLNATPVTEVTRVAAAGDKMPQKSTFFYPKLVTGLVLYRL